MTKPIICRLYANPFTSWTTLAFRIGEIAIASAQVIGQRSNRVAMSDIPPSSKDQREYTQMGQEKIIAAVESTKALTMGMMKLSQQVAMLTFKQLETARWAGVSLALSHSPAHFASRQAKLVRDTMANSTAASSQLSTSAARIMHGGLKPIHARATGNAKRLAKR